MRQLLSWWFGGSSLACTLQASRSVRGASRQSLCKLVEISCAAMAKVCKCSGWLPCDDFVHETHIQIIQLSCLAIYHSNHGVFHTFPGDLINFLCPEWLRRARRAIGRWFTDAVHNAGSETCTAWDCNVSRPHWQGGGCPDRVARRCPCKASMDFNGKACGSVGFAGDCSKR